MPSSWINGNQTGRVSNETDIFHNEVGYFVYNQSYTTYTTRKINDKNMEVKGGEVIGGLEDYFKPCFGQDTLGNKFYCVYRGFGMGYLFKVGSISYHCRSYWGKSNIIPLTRLEIARINFIDI